MEEKKTAKSIRLKPESLLPLINVLNGSGECPTDPFDCLQRLGAAIANSRVRTLKLWILSSQALVSALIGLVPARPLRDVSKPKLQPLLGRLKRSVPPPRGTSV